MITVILIALCFSLGFFVESIIGFGGSLIAYALLGFFIDVKTMVIAGLYIATCSSAYIVYMDFVSFNKKIFFKALPLCLLGTVIGASIFTRLNVHILSLSLGLLLIFLAIKIIFFDKIMLPNFIKNKIILIGGISHGAFGIGGPFLVNALQRDFANKSELRSTMAIFFITFNLVRFVQFGVLDEIDVTFFARIWWVMIPVAIGIYLGFKIHVKTNYDLIKKMIGLITLLGGIKFFTASF